MRAMQVHGALASAGGPAAYSGTEAGFYVGCMYQEYSGVLAASGGKLSAATATGNSLSFMAGRCSALPCSCMNGIHPSSRQG